jgi:hypothetical protein
MRFSLSRNCVVWLQNSTRRPHTLSPSGMLVLRTIILRHCSTAKCHKLLLRRVRLGQMTMDDGRRKTQENLTTAVFELQSQTTRRGGHVQFFKRIPIPVVIPGTGIGTSTQYQVPGTVPVPVQVPVLLLWYRVVLGTR